MLFNFDYYVFLSSKTVLWGNLSGKVIKVDKIFDKLEEKAEKVSFKDVIKIFINVVKVKKGDLIFAAEMLLKYHKRYSVKDVKKIET